MSDVSLVGVAELHSGKHHRTGVNVQLACTLSGDLVSVSDPQPWNMHSTAIRHTGLLDNRAPDDPPHLFGDKGYVGLNMITPKKKPIGRSLLDEDKDYNRQVNQIRYQIERAIANFKTWRILHTDYGRPYETFVQTMRLIQSPMGSLRKSWSTLIFKLWIACSE